MENKKRGISMSLEEVIESHQRFMEMLEKKNYDELGEDELDEDIIKEAFTSALEKKKKEE